MDINDNKAGLTRWLNKLQEESWNLELLISGFAIFGLFRLVDFIELKYALLQANLTDTFLSFGVIQSLIAISAWGVYIFISCLLVHIFFRGLWIGAIGLRYVSGQIEYDNFNYNERFKLYLKRKTGSFDDFIHRLEKISSLIFSLTYLLFFIVFSTFLFIIEVSFVSKLLSGWTGQNYASAIFAIFLYLLGLIVGIDFITLGKLKSIKKKWISVIYLRIYAFIGFITLSFLWRPILYNFIDQKNTKWLAIGSIPFLILLSFFTSTSICSYNLFPKINSEKEKAIFQSVFYKENAQASFNPEFYDDLREKMKDEKKYIPIRVLSIPNYKIKDQVLEVFLKYDTQIENFIIKIDSSIIPVNYVGFNNDLSKKSEFDKEYKRKRKAYRKTYKKLYYVDMEKAELLKMEYIKGEQNAYKNNLEKFKCAIKQSFSIEINGNEISKEEMYIDFFVHPNLGEKGIICNFPLEDVHRGTNYLTLNRMFYAEKTEEFSEYDFSIPFIYNGDVREE